MRWQNRGRPEDEKQIICFNIKGALFSRVCIMKSRRLIGNVVLFGDRKQAHCIRSSLGLDDSSGVTVHHRRSLGY